MVYSQGDWPKCHRITEGPLSKIRHKSTKKQHNCFLPICHVYAWKDSFGSLNRQNMKRHWNQAHSKKLSCEAHCLSKALSVSSCRPLSPASVTFQQGAPTRYWPHGQLDQTDRFWHDGRWIYLRKQLDRLPTDTIHCRAPNVSQPAYLHSSTQGWLSHSGLLLNLFSFPDSLNVCLLLFSSFSVLHMNIIRVLYIFAEKLLLFAVMAHWCH